MASGTDQLTLELRLHDADFARQALDRLVEEPGAVVTRSPARGILPIIPIVIGATIAVHAFAGLIMWLRAKNGCQQIIDARGEKIISEENCRIRDGRIIIIAKDGVKVEIVETPPAIDLTAVIGAAITSGGEAVKQAAVAGGAEVQGGA